MMQQNQSNISFDINILSSNPSSFNDLKGDHIQRVKNEIKVLEQQNEQLRSQLKYIQDNPHEIIKVFQAKLMSRITQLRQQNQGIQQLIQKSKIPGYSQMTKKKTSYQVKTPYKQNKSIRKQQQQYDNFDRKNPFDEIDMSQKYQVSTCQNYNTNLNFQQQNPLRPLQPIQNHQLRARAQITMQLLQIIDRTSQISSQIQQITNNSQNRQIPYNSIHNIAQNSHKIEQIAKYKQKLLHILKKLKIRESTQQKIIEQYQRIYNETFNKFKQATQLLNLLTISNNMDNTINGQNIDDIYAEVLQLEEKLKYINQQLERLDQTQWLKDIQNQLIFALKRLGISLPAEIKQNGSGNFSNQVLRDRIDLLAEILIECVLSHRSDQKQKVALIKMYYEEEKQNNKKIIKTLQNKQQGLSKKLIDLQMNNK